MDLIGQRVAVCLEPLATATAVEPPLPLHTGNVSFVERVVEKVLVAGFRPGSFPDLSAKAKLVDASLATVWAL